jgi:hypothetical protein
MGWASGSDLMASIIDAARPRMTRGKRQNFYTQVIEAFEAKDCDTLHECVGLDPAFDRALAKVSPAVFDEADEE